eukprot:gene17588-23158_t
MVTIVGHKFGAPKGVSALYIKDSLRICPMLIGGGQERGIRAGTENILLNVGLGEACRIAYNEADDILLHLLTLKQSLISKLISSFKYKNINSFILLDSLSNKVACSSGSACHVNESQYKISDVMIAIDIPEEYGLGTVRLSL